MVNIKIEESCLAGREIYKEKKIKDKFTIVAKAIDNLQKEIKEKKISSFSLIDGQQKPLPENFISYKNTGDSFIVYTSHYIGFYQDEKVHIEIKPRLFCEKSEAEKEKLFHHLIYYATNIYIPPSKPNQSLFSSEQFSLLILTLLWKGALEHALTHNYIPKSYIPYQENIRTVRGKIDFTKHLSENLVDQSRFYCNYQNLTFDISINRAIRHVCNFLYKDKVLSALLGDLAGHEQKLASFGVQDRITVSEIDNIAYNRMNEEYKRVMALSKMFLLWQGISEGDTDSLQKYPYCFFIDLAELWENYLLQVLNRHLSDKYKVYSPNFEPNKIYMLKGNKRSIRPDLIIENKYSHEIVAVLDAKYKDYREFGEHAKNPNWVSKDDFYQMNSYLFYYAQNNKDKKLTGLFISPAPMNKSEPDINEYRQNPNLKIGLINLPFQQLLDNWIDKEKIHKTFCEKIEKIIS